MTKLLRKSASTFAIAAALGMFGFASDARADAIAFGTLQISNLFFFDNTNFVTSPSLVGDITVVSTLNTITNTAVLNGTPTITAASSPTTPTDALLACVGTSCGGFAQNNFSPEGFLPALGSFSRSDGLITGNALAGTAAASGVAETQIVGGGTGQAGSQLGLTAKFTFTLDTDLSVGVDFDADLFIATFSTLDSITTGTAGTSWTISITGNVDGIGGAETVFSWTPDGTLNTNITGGTEISDECNLTQNIGFGSPGDTATSACNDADLTAVTNTLIARRGDGSIIEYDLTITHTQQTQLITEQVVPEPMTLMLFATGLLGIGLAARRRRRV